MNRFKVGDKVRYTDSEGPWVEWQIYKTCEGVVISKSDDEGFLEVDFGGRAEVHETDLELVETADPTREFLERLQELLREFDAQISFYEDEDEASLCFDFGDHTQNIWYTKQFCGDRRFEFPLTAENIMDFDK